MLSGIINVYKEKGYTSFDVVAKLRGILKTRKIGHTGTLDPDAEGVLPVCLGKATKVCALLTDREKEYEAVMLLGVETDTQDITGNILAQREVAVSEEEVREAVPGFVGDILQVPPMYSALKVDGKRLYELARSGLTVERKARQVHIFEIEILEIMLPRVRMRVHCGKGTYIRTLCADIGEKLGCGACMESLLRTRVADFSVSDALRISQIEALLNRESEGHAPESWRTEMFSFLAPIDRVFLQYASATVLPEYEKLLHSGGRLVREMFDGYQGEWETDALRVYDAKGRFVGIYRFQPERADYKPLKVFWEP